MDLGDEAIGEKYDVKALKVVVQRHMLLSRSSTYSDEALRDAKSWRCTSHRLLVCLQSRSQLLSHNYIIEHSAVKKHHRATVHELEDCSTI